jgi:hypothetical protein
MHLERVAPPPDAPYLEACAGPLKIFRPHKKTRQKKMKGKDHALILEAIQAQSPFDRIPVNWKPLKKGPKIHVSGAAFSKISIEINVKQAGDFEEFVALVNAALKHASDMYRGLTSASGIGEPHDPKNLRQLPYQPTEHEHFALLSAEQAHEMKVVWSEEMVEVIEKVFG